jgi:hypothetical protein
VSIVENLIGPWMHDTTSFMSTSDTIKLLFPLECMCSQVISVQQAISYVLEYLEFGSFTCTTQDKIGMPSVKPGDNIMGITTDDLDDFIGH